MEETVIDFEIVATTAPPNEPPLLELGGDLNAVTNRVLTLAATIVDDGFAGPMTVTWTALSGPGGVAFAEASSATTEATFSAAGVYELEISVSDSEFMTSASLFVTVTDSVSKNLLFLVDDIEDLSDEEAAILRQLDIEDGHSLTVVGRDSSAESAFGYDAVLVSEGVVPLDASWTSSTAPLLAWGESLEELELATNLGGVSESFIEMAGSSHPMELAAQGTTRFAASGAPSLSTPGSGAQIVASLPGTTDAILFSYEVGAEMIQGPAAGRRVALPFGAGGAEQLTADGKDLLRAAISWGLGETPLLPVRLLPLGDSITQGTRGYYSYRQMLWSLTDAANCFVDYVGASQGPVLNDPLDLFDNDHDGHSGYRTKDVQEELSGWLEGNTPDLAMVHLGTNDLNQGYPLGSSMLDLTDIITELRSANPNVVIFLAQIINGERAAVASGVEAYNDAVVALAGSLDTANSPIILVDHFSDYDPTILNHDELHPNEQGELEMATRWYGAVSPYAECL